MWSYTDIRDAIIHGNPRCDPTQYTDIWDAIMNGTRTSEMRSYTLHGHPRCDNAQYTDIRDAIIHVTRTSEIRSYTLHGHPRCDHTRYTGIRVATIHVTRTSEMRSYTDIGLHVKYLLFLSDFEETWIFLTNFLKTPKYQILWKPIQWEPAVCHADGRTNTTKLKIRFLQFLCWLCFG